MTKPDLLQQRFLLLLTYLGIAFAIPLWHLFAQFEQHKPDAIRVFIPIIGAAWLYLRLRQSAPQLSDINISFGCALISCLAVFLCYLLPSFSMRYWQFQWLLIPVFACGNIALLFGAGALRRSLPVLLYSLLLWPPLIHLLSSIFTPFLLAVSEGGCFLFIHALDLPVHVPSDHLLTCQTPNGSEQLRIGSPCSGINGFLALVLCLIPLLIEGRISNNRRIIIAAAGFTLLCILSFLRLSLLTWITCRFGSETAFYYFHLLGGVGLFFVLCCSLLLFSASLGLRLPIPPRDPVQVKKHKKVNQSFIIAYVGFSLVLCFGTWLLHAKPLIPKPPHIMHHFSIKENGHKMPQITGVESWHVRSMDWTQPLFGDNSKFDRFAYELEHRIYWVDSLLVTEFDLLELHNVFDCYRWHDYELISQEFESSLADIPARRYHYRDTNQREWLSITWIESINSEGEIWWQRFHVQLECPPQANSETLKQLVSQFSERLCAGR